MSSSKEKQPPPGTIIFDLDSPLTCLCTNRDATLLAVAGRNVLQMFRVEDNAFSQVYKAKAVSRTMGGGGIGGPGGISSQLNYSVSDIAWSPTDESLLATASTNGSILLWDFQNQRQLVNKCTYAAHTRTTHRVLFHPSDTNSLLSASQDGTVRIFDIRSEIQPGLVLACKGMSSPARDVQYSPNNHYNLAAAHENGQLVLWDVRNPGRPERTMTCHSGPILCIDWHPNAQDGRNWLATAGSRDHMIKVWDMEQASSHPLYYVRTSNVTRIRWRPEKETQLASCSNLTIDLSVHVWDLERPYIPYASFEGHRDVITAIAWKNDKSTFFSAGKDGLLIRHSFKNAIRVADSMNPVALDMNPQGELMMAVSQEKIDPQGCTNYPIAPGQQMYLRQLSNASISKLSVKRVGEKKKGFTAVSSMLFDCVLRRNETEDWNLYECLLPDVFKSMVTNYRVSGGSISELCDHNAKVAEMCNQPTLSSFWTMLKCICGSNQPIVSSNAAKDTVTEKSEMEKVSDSRQNDSERDTSRDKNKIDTSTVLAPTVTFELRGNTDDSPDNQTEDDMSHLVSIAGGDLAKEPADFLFSDGLDCDFIHEDLFQDSAGVEESLPLSGLPTNEEGQRELLLDSGVLFESSLPREAFNPRHEIVGHVSSQQQLDADTDSALRPPVWHNTAPKVVTAHTQRQHRPHRVSRSERREVSESSDVLLSEVPSLPSPPMCDLSELVVPQLVFLVEAGSLPTACTALLVLGERVNLGDQVDEAKLENWFMAYIDLLTRFRLWNVITCVINRCSHPTVSGLNQQSTTVMTRCGRCNKVLDRYGAYCHRHKDPTPVVCCICHQTVRGLFLWCQGCSHGGHIEHVTDWLKRRDFCPSGCGHRCEYT